MIDMVSLGFMSLHDIDLDFLVGDADWKHASVSPCLLQILSVET